MYLGQCCRTGKESGADGLHFRRFPAVPHPGILGGVEHGELGGGGALCYPRVSQESQTAVLVVILIIICTQLIWKDFIFSVLQKYL